MVILINNFSGLNDYVKKILRKILNSDDLCKLIYYDIKDISDKEITNEQKLTMINGDEKDRRIFPYPFIPGTTVETKTVLSFYFDRLRLARNNKEFNFGEIIFDIFSHEDIWLMEDFEVRVYSIMSEIDKIFNNTDELGIGRLQLDSQFGLTYLPPFSQNSTFYGYRLRYINYDFNKVKK